MYQIKSLNGTEILHVDRVGKDKLSLKIGEQKVTAFTEDLAAMIKMELPTERGNEIFSEFEEKSISKGKVGVVVQAQKDIKKGEAVAFSIDVTKYLDRQNNPLGIRTAKTGLIF